jgi:cell division protein FtsQ
VRRLSRTGPRRPRRGAALVLLYRVIRWLVVPAVVVVGVAGTALSGLRLPVEEIRQQAETWLIDQSAALGLRVADIRVEGRGTTDRATILAALGAGLGTPILAVDPARAEKRLEALPWVSSAVIERRLPDILYVRLAERTPLALWQHDGKLQLIDETGSIIPVTRLDRFAKLTLVVGADAARHAARLRAMLAKEPDLEARVTAAVRVGGRRWNLRIDGRIDVLLPADDAAGALAALARLERSSAILDRAVEVVDMRLPDRLVVRVSPLAPKEPAAVPVPGKGRPAAKNT